MVNQKRAIARRAAEIAEMTDEEYFTSPKFVKYLSNVLKALVTASKSRQIKLSVYARDDGSTACTNGMNVAANASSPLVTYFQTRKDRFLCLVGKLTHECGHLLFSDFTAVGEFRESFRTGSLPPYVHDGLVEKVWDTMNAKGVAFRKTCGMFLREFQNVFEDGFVEYYLKKYFSGIPQIALKVMRKAIWETMRPLEKVMEEAPDNPLNWLFVGGLGYITKGKVKGRKKAEQEYPDESKRFGIGYEIVERYAQVLTMVENGQKRNIILYQFLCEIFPFLEAYWEQSMQKARERKNKSEEEENGGNGQEKEDESQKNSREDSAEESINDSFEDEAEPNDNREEGNEVTSPDEEPSEEDSDEPSEEGSSSNTGDDGQEQEESDGKGTSSSNSDDTTGKESDDQEMNPEELAEEAARFLEEFLKEENVAQLPEGVQGKAQNVGTSFPTEEEIPDLDDATEAATTEMETERMENEIRNMEWSGSDLENIFIHRPQLSGWEAGAYNADLKEMKPIVDRTVRLLDRVFKERNREGELSGELIGKRLDTRTLYRQDGRNFKRELVPDGPPDVAFAILIDESGSMKSSDPDKMAKKTSICLEAILRKVGVPVAIVGHTADQEGIKTVSLFKYCDFNSYRTDDRYRLERIGCYSTNHDEQAILYAGSLLKNRPEKNKVLIVISDGIPSSCCFKSEEDGLIKTAEAARKMEKWGIALFAAALQDSYEQVVEIYGEKKVLDISDLNRLPGELAKLVRRYCLKR